jgi:hypothetical protein
VVALVQFCENFITHLHFHAAANNDFRPLSSTIRYNALRQN